MHTVVFGWFGASAVWFIPLLWRIAKSVLPNGGGLRGPGTIRLWLGFFCVLISSCVLEAALFHSFGFAADLDHVGRALLETVTAREGVVSTPGLLSVGAAAGVAFLVSLPWLCDFTWRQAIGWANGSFGLGLDPAWFAQKEDAARSKPVRRRETESRGGIGGWFGGSARGDAKPASRSAGASGRVSHDAPSLGVPTATQREGGRYQRPTVWRPPPARRSQDGQPARVREAARPVQGPGSEGSTSVGARRSGGNLAETRPGASRATASIEPMEPVAPAGWLKTAPVNPGKVGARNVGGRGPGSGTSGASGASGTSGTSLHRPANVTVAPPRQEPARVAPSRPVAPTGRAPAAPAVVSSTSFFASTHTSAGTPMEPAAPLPAPDDIKQALRSIEQSTAQWITRPTAADPASHDASNVPPGEDTASSSIRQPATPSSESPSDELKHETAVHRDRASDDTPSSPAGAAGIQSSAAVPAVIEAMDGGEPDAPLGSNATSVEAGGEAIHARDETADTAAVLPISASSIAGSYSSNVLLHDGYAITTGAQAIVRETTTVNASSMDVAPLAEADAESVHTPELPETIATPYTANDPADAEIAASAPPSSLAHEARPTTPFSRFAADEATPSHEQAESRPLLSPFGREPDAHPQTRSNDSPRDNPNDANDPNDAIYPYAASADRDAVQEASNVVHFPRASTGPITPPPPSPSPSPQSDAIQPDGRPPIRGFIATEFAFHAPSASAVDLPGLDLLEQASDEIEPVTEQHLAETGQLIEQRLQEFKVPVTVVGASAGPVITRFEVEPALGVRGSQIVGLMKDLSRGLGLTSIRVVETIPGKTCMGLELPNAKRQMIRLSEILEADVYRDSKSFLTIAMGKDIVGNPVVTDLARAPHMLVAGTTGSGKSVAINAMILSLLFKAKPEDVRLIMIDPKMLELSVYEGIPHLLAPVVTDMKLAANALNWCVGEMEKRYKLMSAVGVRNLQGFNQKVRNADAAGKKLTNPFSLTPDAPEPLSKLPMIVVVIDELADLMMVAGKQIEQLIARLAQKARAAGIHLILATQRPSVDVITGLIKANIPTRVAFQVSSKIDSRTILDQMGAESLLGAGDMLFLPPGTGYPQRIHGAFVADEEVHSVVEYLKQFGEPEYEEGILAGPTPEGGTPDMFGDTADAEADPLYDEAVSFVLRARRASISSVQRQLRIGYNRAARLVEQMESAGLVSPMGTNGNREVLAPAQPERD